MLRFLLIITLSTILSFSALAQETSASDENNTNEKETCFIIVCNFYYYAF